MVAAGWQPDSSDWLKFVVAYTTVGVDGIGDRFATFIDRHPGDEAEIRSLLGLLQNVRDRAVEAVAVSFAVDDDRYSDGRQVLSSLEIEPGSPGRRPIGFSYCWHPQPDHWMNQPHVLVDRHVFPSGRRRSIVVSSPGVLAVIDHGPDN